LEIKCRHSWRLNETELEVDESIGWFRIALISDLISSRQTRTLYDDIFSARFRFFVSVLFENTVHKREDFRVRSQSVSKVSTGGDEVKLLIWTGSDEDVLFTNVPFEVFRVIVAELILKSPSIEVSFKRRGDDFATDSVESCAPECLARDAMTITEAGFTTFWIVCVQIEVVGCTFVALFPHNVVFTFALASCIAVTAETSFCIAVAPSASTGRESVIPRFAVVTFVSSHTQLASTLSLCVATQRMRTHLVATARFTHILIAFSVVELLATLAVYPCCIFLAVNTTASTHTIAVKPQLFVENTFVSKIVTIACSARVGRSSSSPSPWTIVVERETFFTVFTGSIVVALTVMVTVVVTIACRSMSVAFATPSNGDIRHSNVVTLQDLWVTENLVTERVETIEVEAESSYRHPLLKFRILIEVLLSWSVEQSKVGDITPTKRNHTTELIRTQCNFLIGQRNSCFVGQSVSFFTCSGVELVWQPCFVLVVRGFLVDGEGMWTNRVKSNPHESNVVLLFEVEDEMGSIFLL